MRRPIGLLAAAMLLAGCTGGEPGLPPSSAATTSPVTTSPVTTSPVTTSPVTTSPATTSPVTDGEGGEACPSFGPPEAVGTLAPAELDEVSGIAASRSLDGVLWVHEDSGAGPLIWGLDDEGSLLGTVVVGGAEAVDWEDIALGPGPSGGDWIYVADTGDNAAIRPAVALYRFPEPDPSAGSVTAQAIRVTYPAGPADVEALLVDPETGDAFLIAKRLLDAPEVYRVPAAAWDGGQTVAERAGDLGLGLTALIGGPVTAADASPDGDLLAVRTYGAVWVWRRGPGTEVAAALAEAPCPAPAPPEIQGEALALDEDGYLTVAEGAGATLWRVTGESVSGR